MESSRLSKSWTSLKSNSSIISAEATVIVGPTEASFTSAVMVTLSGISRSSSFSFRFSESPGKPSPTTIFLSASDMIFPLSISTLVYSSMGSIMDVTMVNGVYISTFSPSISTFSFEWFSYSIWISTLPSFPASSSAFISFPSNL